MFTLSQKTWASTILTSFFVGTALSQGLLTCPDECKCYFDSQTLLHADCSNKELIEVPIGLDEQTQVLDLSNNYLTVVPPEFLTPMIYLEKLNLSGNQISALSSYSLVNMTSLTVLDLSGNLISEWEDINPNTILKPATSLRKLILSKNPFNAIANLRSMEILVSSTLHALELEDCRFTSIAGRSPIAGLTDLRQLSLSRNPLKRIQRLTSPTLRYLDLSYCELTFIASDELNFLPMLTHLRLSHNIRLSINDGTDPSNRLSSPSIIHIDLSFCNMDHVSLGGFPGLQAANLRGNMLRRLGSGEFLNNTHLRSLDLSSNSIEYVHKNAFDGLVSLTTLNLSINVIPFIHDYTFLRLYNLTSLYLSRNYLSSVGFMKSSSVQTLDMSYCEIQHFEKNSLEGLTALEEINFSKNLISSIPDLLFSKTLKVLDLRFNRVSRISNHTFAYLPSLTALHLSENRFSNIWYVSYFDANPNLEELTMHDNTWRCDCSSPHMKSFYDFITKYPPKVWNINDIHCETPTNMTGKTWYEACYFIWSGDNFLTGNQRALTYFLTVFIICFIIGFVIMLIRRAQHARELALREQRERELQEERDRARELRMRREQEQQRNAPDPRDLVSPPSYDEAILMPRLDGSFHSLAGVGVSQEKKHRRRMKRMTKSSNDLLELDSDSRSSGRKSRRRRQSTTSDNATRQEMENLQTENRTDNSQNESTALDAVVVHRLHESDF